MPQPIVRVACFVRVSKKSQEVDRQIHDLTSIAERLGYQVVATISEKLSGSKLTAQRPELLKLLELARTRSIDKVFVSEVSRLGRRTSEVLQVIEALTENRVSVYAHNYGLETLGPDGKRNPIAQLMFTMLAEFARLEKEMLVDRINSGLDEARRKGKVLGRPAGSTIDDEQLLAKYPQVKRELKAGTSIRKTAKICDVTDNTVQKVKKAMVALQMLETP